MDAQVRLRARRVYNAAPTPRTQVEAALSEGRARFRITVGLQNFGILGAKLHFACKPRGRLDTRSACESTSVPVR